MRLDPLRVLTLGLVFALGAAASSDAAVSFDDGLFSDGMVLQQGRPAPIFGSAAPGEAITVTFDGQVKNTNAAPDGSWRVDLDPLTVGGPHQLVVQGDNQLVIDDVLVGEVWVCAGQSNMVLRVVGASVLGSEPDIRVFRIKDWSDAAGLACWEFGRRLHTMLGVPIGLLNNAKGGSKIRTWLGPTIVTDPDPEVASIVASYGEWGVNYNNWTAPLQPYAVRGIAWWQGESDRRQPDIHGTILPAMMRSWRDDWGQPDLPFVMVQLPKGKGMPADDKRLKKLPRKALANHRTPALRQAFIETLFADPLTSLVANADLRGGIHPPQSVIPDYGVRIADAALADVYGLDFVYSGPIIATATDEAGSVRLTFRPNTADGLYGNLGPLQGFDLTADLVTWVNADSQIEGDEVVVSSPSVPAPVAVRYGWGRRFRWANLFNSADLAAAPFEVAVPTPAP